MRLLSIYFGTLTSFILANPIVHNLNDPISGLEIRSSSQSIDKLVYAFENLSESDDASCMSGHTAEKRSEGNHLDRSRDVSVVRRLSNACPVKGFRVIPAPTTEPTLNPERKPTPKKSPTKSPDEPLNVPPSQDTNSHCLDSFFKKIVTCGGPEINASPDFFSIVPGVVNCVRGRAPEVPARPPLIGTKKVARYCCHDFHDIPPARLALPCQRLTPNADIPQWTSDDLIEFLGEDEEE